jgi:DNA-binding Lrp family transcriptional regulator
MREEAVREVLLRARWWELNQRECELQRIKEWEEEIAAAREVIEAHEAKVRAYNLHLGLTEDDFMQDDEPQPAP